MRKPMMTVDVFVYWNNGAWSWLGMATNVCPGMRFVRGRFVKGKNPDDPVNNELRDLAVYRYGSLATARKSAREALSKVQGARLGREWEGLLSAKKSRFHWELMQPRRSR